MIINTSLQRVRVARNAVTFDADFEWTSLNSLLLVWTRVSQRGHLSNPRVKDIGCRDFAAHNIQNISFLCRTEYLPETI